MPEPLSAQTGFGMKVAVLPYWCATMWMHICRSERRRHVRSGCRKRYPVRARRCNFVVVLFATHAHFVDVVDHFGADVVGRVNRLYRAAALRTGGARLPPSNSVPVCVGTFFESADSPCLRQRCPANVVKHEEFWFCTEICGGVADTADFMYAVRVSRSNAGNGRNLGLWPVWITSQTMIRSAVR